MIGYQFDTTGNYKEEMELYVEAIEQSAKQLTEEERLHTVDQLIESYVEQIGDKPDGLILHRLANVLLTETLTDTNHEKMSHEEYPIMSDQQHERRLDRETELEEHFDGYHRMGTRTASYVDKNGTPQRSKQQIHPHAMGRKY